MTTPPLLATIYTGRGVKPKKSRNQRNAPHQGRTTGETAALELDSPTARNRQRRNKMPKAEALLVYRAGACPIQT